MGADAGSRGPCEQVRETQPSGQGTHRGMLPVQDDLWNVLHRMQEVIVSPLIPVDGHRAIFIHALENFFCLLLRYLDSQVPQGLHDLLSINSSIVLFIQTLEYQPQFLLMILEIMDKLFKV